MVGNPTLMNIKRLKLFIMGYAQTECSPIIFVCCITDGADRFG